MPPLTHPILGPALRIAREARKHGITVDRARRSGVDDMLGLPRPARADTPGQHARGFIGSLSERRITVTAGRNALPVAAHEVGHLLGRKALRLGQRYGATVSDDVAALRAPEMEAAANRSAIARMRRAGLPAAEIARYRETAMKPFAGYLDDARRTLQERGVKEGSPAHRKALAHRFAAAAKVIGLHRRLDRAAAELRELQARDPATGVFTLGGRFAADTARRAYSGAAPRLARSRNELMARLAARLRREEEREPAKDENQPASR